MHLVSPAALSDLVSSESTHYNNFYLHCLIYVAIHFLVDFIEIKIHYDGSV